MAIGRAPAWVLRVAWVALLLDVAGLGCAAARASRRADTPAVHALRDAARASANGELVAQWALAEMFAPGGSADEARAARKRLEQVPHEGMWASLARGVYDDEHGDPRMAAEGYLATVAAAPDSTDPLTPLAGWYAVRHLLALRGPVAGLFSAHRVPIEAVLARPGHLGWRAVADLEDWRASEVYDKVERSGQAYDDEVVARMGCASRIRIAGPFGHGAPADVARSYPAEDGVPWPLAWAPDPVRGTVPRVLSVTQTRCLAVADEQVEDGVFYLEGFFTTRGDRELVIAVQGAVAVWVDGALAMTRMVRDWGGWQRFGVHISVGDGRHRVLARSVTPGGSIRLLNPDGTSAHLPTDGDARAGHAVEPAQVLDDPNPIDARVRALSQGGAVDAPSPVASILAAHAAQVDQVDDVAAALLAPAVEPVDAAGVALELSATLASGDPAWPQDARASRSRELRERALVRDRGLWRARLASTLEGTEQHGLIDAVEPLRRLAGDVPGEPEILEQLARLYGRLGWRGDQRRSLEELARRFPDDVAALRAYLGVLDETGPAAEAETVAARIEQLDPDADVQLDRALARRDYAAALRELARMHARRPDRKDLNTRRADILARAGDVAAASDQLEKSLATHPRDAQARFRLADGAFARGDSMALERALAAALQSNASAGDLRSAIDLVEGATDLEPYRQDGRAIIASYQAWERSGHHMDGTAARVLDYAAIWAHDDGSSEMLEHEIQKIQSQEAIGAESETEPPGGLVLHLRVIKPDGSILEPEPVSGKPTLTLPHVEVGDFIEVEHITSQASDGTHGRRYRSPQWFFREADKGYWRSEFVVVAPARKPIEIETHGQVPAPRVAEHGEFVERRWRVDLSPPAELEPDGPVIAEFLPSVRLGWGITLDVALAQLVDLVDDETPLDPRLRTVALDAVRGVAATSTDERARRLYRWVLDHVHEGKETDGRRVVTGRSGSRQAAFRFLLRLVGIESELALVKNRLAMSPDGPLSALDQYDALVLRVQTDRGLRWLTVKDKFAPFGYVPAEWRDQDAVRLVPGTPHEVVRAPGAVDAIVYAGRAELHDDGSALLDLTLTFDGNRAIAWRAALEQIAPGKLYDFVDRELIAPAFDGGHVRDVKAESASEPDVPLVLHMHVDAPQFAKQVRAGIAVHPPFAPSLAALAALPRRRTPLVRRTSFRAEVRVHVVLPASARHPPVLAQGEERDGEAFVSIKDTAGPHELDFERTIAIPSGRVAPGAEYASWQRFVQGADALLTRDVVIAK